MSPFELQVGRTYEGRHRKLRGRKQDSQPRTITAFQGMCAGGIWRFLKSVPDQPDRYVLRVLFTRQDGSTDHEHPLVFARWAQNEID